MIYLDNNASTRVFERVADAMDQFGTTRYANPRSAAGTDQGLDAILVQAVRSIGAVVGADNPEQWVLTSGATESNNLALLGSAAAAPERRHLVVSAIEHPSIYEPARALERRGYELTIAEVDRRGEVRVDAILQAIRRDTLLVSVMTANNETGVIQPVTEVANTIKREHPGVLVHTDATQGITKLDIDLGRSHAGIDLLAFSAHKCHGPKGAGALFIRDGRRIAPLFYGGGQQRGLRPGTESPSLAMGTSVAIETACERMLHYRAIAALRDRIESEIVRSVPGAFIVGGGAPRLPTTTCLCLPGWSGAGLAVELAAIGIAIGSGSACHRGSVTPSRVALAMGLSPAEALSCIRVSLSLETSATEVEEFLTEFLHLLRRRHAALNTSR